MIFPIGFGVVITALSEKTFGDGFATFELRACHDGFTQADGVSVEEAWDKAQGPWVQLTFKDTAAVDRIIEDLNNLKKVMEKEI